MGDCLLALQECSLISLDESPQLIRRSLLCQSHHPSRSGSQHLPTVDVPPAPRAVTHSKAADSPSKEPAALKTVGSVAVTTEGAQAPAAAWLDCSLPLVSSASPEIAGIKPPRSRFRRAAAPIPAEQAAGFHEAWSAKHSGVTVGELQVVEAGGHVGEKKQASSAAGPCLAQNARDIYPPAADVAKCHPHHQQGATDWRLLQQLLDDSSGSSLSCLPAAYMQPSAEDDGTPAPNTRAPAWRYGDDADTREMTRSAGSDVTGFQGFWSATPGEAQSTVDYSPAPVGKPLVQHNTSIGAGFSQPCTPVLADSHAPVPAQARPCPTAASQQETAALMMLLSLNQSAVCHASAAALKDAGSASQPPSLGTDCVAEPKLTASPRAASPQPNTPRPAVDTCLPSPDAAVALGSTQVASPATADRTAVLQALTWEGGEHHHLSLRYAAASWPSPDNSPGVLLSSPVQPAAFHGPRAASHSVSGQLPSGQQASDATLDISSTMSKPRETAERAGNKLLLSQAASAEGGRRLAALRAVDTPNALEFSPVRGLTLWGDASTPLTAGHLEAPAADSPEDDGMQAVHDTDTKRSACSSAANNQFEQLKRLLTSSSSSDEEWHDVDAGEAAAVAAAVAQENSCSSTLAAEVLQDGQDDAESDEHEPQAALHDQQGVQQMEAATGHRLPCSSPGLQVQLDAVPESLNEPSDRGSTSPAFHTPVDTPRSDQFVAAVDPILPAAALAPEQMQKLADSSTADAAVCQACCHTDADQPDTAVEASCKSWAPGAQPEDAVADADQPHDPSRPPLPPQPAAADSCHPPVALRTAEPKQGFVEGAAGSSSTHTQGLAAGRHSPVLLQASIAESFESFYGAAAGEPYACTPQAPRSGPRTDMSTQASLTWRAYDGLGALWDSDQPPTPASVLCKKAWLAQDRAAGGLPAPSCSTGGADAAVGGGNGAAQGMGASEAVIEQQPEAGSAMCAAGSDGGNDVANLVAQLQQQLRDAELRCTQQQMSMNQARQLVLERELEVERLRAGLMQSEQEGEGCLEALEAALDIITTTDDANDQRNSPLDTDAKATAAAAVCEGGGGDADVVDCREEVPGCGQLESLQQQCMSLQEHNEALQSTLAEAGEQLDAFEAQVQHLTADRSAAEQQLAAVQARLAQQQAEHAVFLQSELDEQQDQHEQEVRELHAALDEQREKLQELRGVTQTSSAAAQRSQAQVASLQQQLSASKEHVQGLQQQLEQLQAVLQGQENESAASSEQLSRQVAQLLNAQQELQHTNARLVEAEAEYASSQLALGCRNQELEKQLQDALSSNKRLEAANQQLQAQNSSLSQMMQSLRPDHGAGSISSTHAATAATPTSSTAQSRSAVTSASDMDRPTPMRRRMASVNAQLERRVQELLQQKQALAAQVEQLQLELGQQGSSSTPSGLTAQQQVAMDELQQRVEHLTTCNDELMQQLEELDWSHEQLQAEKLDLEGRCSELEQETGALLAERDNQQQVGTGGHDAGLVQDLRKEKDETAKLCQQQQEELTSMRQQLSQFQEQHRATQNNTALFEQCNELKQQVQELQQQLQQERAGALRTSREGLDLPAGAVILDSQHASQPLQKTAATLQQPSSHQRQQGEHMRLEYERLAADLTNAQQQLAMLQSKLQEAERSSAKECKASSEAHADKQAALDALARMEQRNSALIEQLIQLQLTAPARVEQRPADSTPNIMTQGGCHEGGGSTVSLRATVNAGVQANMGGTDVEKATAVQQLLLLQAQAQLHDMEEQNRQAAQRHVESKRRIAQLQGSLTQQEAQLQAAEEQLRHAQQQHRRATASLQRENEQLVRQLADARVQLQVLQTANTHLEGRVQQRQQDLQQHAAAAQEVQVQMEAMKHQQRLDQLQLASVTAELTACRDHAQQLVAAQEKEATAIAVLQQKLQQAQSDSKKAAATAAETSSAAYDALEQRLACEVKANKQQAERLMTEKSTLMVELQQTKATVDCLEDSVRRLGLHNAHLVQQIKDSCFKSASTASCRADAQADSTSVSLLSANAARGGPEVCSTSSHADNGGKKQASRGDVTSLSPKALHNIIAAATRVNEKNKQLKRQLQMAMQGQPA